MFEKKHTTYDQLLNIIKTQTLSGCNRRIGISKEFLTWSQEFFENIENSAINWSDSHSTIFTNIANIVMELVHTPKAGKTMELSDIVAIKKIFDVAMNLANSSANILLVTDAKEKNRIWQLQFEKVGFLQLIISQFKLFNGYADIAALFEYIDSNWEDLIKRGFTKKVLSDFSASIDYNAKTDRAIPKDKRLDVFMHILDGSMKFQPQFEMRAIAYQIIPSDSDESFILNIGSEYSKGYGLKPPD